MNVRILVSLLALAAAAPALAKDGSHGSSSGGSHHVNGHITKDGTYVQGHQATNPNGTKLDNWSTKGNTNPTTGKEGTKDPSKP